MAILWGGAPMFKAIFFLKRKPGISHEQFREHYENSHVKLADKYLGHLMIDAGEIDVRILGIERRIEDVGQRRRSLVGLDQITPLEDGDVTAGAEEAIFDADAAFMTA